VELLGEFATFVTNVPAVKLLIYQDSTLAITMVTDGGGTTRTKHMQMRLHLVLEVVGRSPKEGGGGPNLRNAVT
jgi:hypothetical protein